MTSYSITRLIADIKLTNNGRLVALAMTAQQIRIAERALERGAVKKNFMQFPGFGQVAAYSLA